MPISSVVIVTCLLTDFRCELTASKIVCVYTDTACMELFSKMRSSGHCLPDILPHVSNHAVL